jgi:putative ATPase
MKFPTPLAEQLRPRSLDEYVGQDHLLKKGAVLRKAIEAGNVPSMILWGPPGVGKTTLASIISQTLVRPFFSLSAINSGVKDVREVIENAASTRQHSILFIDEIHRFSKAQQDSLLGAVERGIVTLIGATTENPSFEVISPLLSRCQVYALQSLGKENLQVILDRAVAFIQANHHLNMQVEETEALFLLSGGDARKLLNIIELITSLHEAGSDLVISNDGVRAIVQKNLALYDKQGEMHYDIISAFIKSIRGSDPNAAVYWLARMIEGGEDILFIARRMLILASEDIGNANPTALVMANNCFDAVHRIGYPEGRIILSQTAIYLACSPKSNASYMAIGKAQELVARYGTLPVPLHLRNAPTKLMKELGYAGGYKYAHNYQGNFTEQQFLPDAIPEEKIYDPGQNTREEEFRKRLREQWKKYGY